MNFRPTPTGLPTPPLLIAAGALATAIFVVDTFLPWGMAIAVLYVIVVMLAANFCNERGVLLVGFGCAALTLLSFSIQHGTDYESPSFMRCLASLAAIGLMTFLTVKNKAAETALREQANLLDVTHDAIFVRDANDVIRYWNRGAEELYGWSAAEAIGNVSHQFMRTVFPLPLNEIESVLLRTGRWAGELIHTKRDGQAVTVESRWSVQLRERGQPIAILETNNDVTDRRRAESALRRSEAYLVEAQRLSCTGSFGWNPATGEIVWSAETFRIFQYDPAKKPTLDVVRERTHPADLRAVERLLERASNNFVNWEIEHRLLLPDGTIRHVRVVAHAERDTKGNLEYVGAIMDVTAARRAEDELRQAQTNLAHVNRVTTLGEMSASIAHEVSQPLAAIVTNAGAGLRWLAADHSNLEEVKQTLSRIYKDGNRANDIISRIRDLSKKIPAQKDRLNLNEVILEVVALVRGEAERGRAAVTTDLSRDQALVSGDRVQLQQVILNLIINAIEAMSGSENGQSRDLLVTSRMQSASDVLVAVRDSGPGLDPEQLDRVFDAFYTTKTNGIGMGLAICRSIIEAHDGRLWATPNEPRGAVFQFSLRGVE